MLDNKQSRISMEIWKYLQQLSQMQMWNDLTIHVEGMKQSFK